MNYQKPTEHIEEEDVKRFEREKPLTLTPRKKSAIYRVKLHHADSWQRGVIWSRGLYPMCLINTQNQWE